MKLTLQCALILGLTASCYGEIVLPKVVASKMILQRGVSAPIWGWADAGEEVTVEFAGQTKKALPDSSGKWSVNLDPLEASMEPRVMTLRGKNEILLDDVLVGEVWLASGQSNMEWTLAACHGDDHRYAATQATNGFIRVFHVEKHLQAGVPLDDTVGRWKTTEEFLAARMNTVSAVGFFFALKLQQELGIPVAFIDANWGGQRIEPFVPNEGYEAMGKKMGSNLNDPAVIVERLDKLVATIEATKAAVQEGQRPLVELDPNLYGWTHNALHNAMIAPVAPFAIRGAIWYQGESNRSSTDYFEKLQALSAGWSEIFQVKDIPFYQVQIAPYAYVRHDLRNTTLCENIWKAQYKGAKEIPGMGIVAIHDTNIDIYNIHPVHKRPVGDRLAAQALKNQYGRNVITSGPSVGSVTLSGANVIVSFTDVDQGLTTSDSQAPSWFELSSDGKTFVPAEAVIVGNTVSVNAAAVPVPSHIRMGWAETAIPNLADKNGWPVFAFPSQLIGTP